MMNLYISIQDTGIEYLMVYGIVAFLTGDHGIISITGMCLMLLLIFQFFMGININFMMAGGTSSNIESTGIEKGITDIISSFPL